MNPASDQMMSVVDGSANPSGLQRRARPNSDDEAEIRALRAQLLWEAASVLLTTDDPDSMMREIFQKLSAHFGLDTYFNYMLDDSGTHLRLESCIGISPEIAASIKRLEFGQAVCGAVALSREPITATRIQQSEDPRVQLVKSFGIRAYACNPLIANGRLLGTLSFASRARDSFESDELEFLRTVCHYVTLAYERLRIVRELRESDRKKDDFIALLAHELRNPLAPIRNGLELMKLAPRDVEAVTQARSIMDRQLSHMVRLIDDLLDISRINRNKMDLRKSRVLLADVVANAIETSCPQLDAAGHDLIVKLPSHPIALDADLTRLAQVFANLLTNSAKYTPPGGQVWLSAEQRDGIVVVQVRDTGIGIPASSLPTIFDMFSQVDRPIERASGGLGIGLALVKGLVEMHGGAVCASSDGAGTGSTFTVTLPIVPDDQQGMERAVHSSEKSVSCWRILVVDDNRDGAESMAAVLRLMGNDVMTAHDGNEAFDSARKHLPHIILMDIGMPMLNGLDATRAIRAEDWGKTMNIVALTGWGQEADKARSLEAGCNGHLVKPASLSDLEFVLREFAGNQPL